MIRDGAKTVGMLLLGIVAAVALLTCLDYAAGVIGHHICLTRC